MIKQNIPLIRFEGFKGEWIKQRLGEIGETYSGLSGKTKDDFGKGNARFITYVNVYSNAIADISGLDKIGVDEKQNEVKYGDVLFTTSSETPHEVGMTSVWLGDKENIYLNSFCFGYRPIFQFNPYYLGYLLRSKQVRSEISFLAQGISRFNISKNKVMEIEIPTISESEQSKIGSLFSTIDSLLSSYKDNLENYQAFKKSMLSKMFPKAGQTVPEIRLEGFEGKWQRVKMGDIFSQKVDYIEPNEKNELWSLTVEKGLTPKTERYKRDFLVKKTDKFKRVKPNDFAYNPMNLTLGSLDANQLGKSISVSGYYVVMSIEDYSKYDIDYFKILLKTSFAIFQYKQYATGTLIEKQRVQFPTFSEISFALPSLYEQRAIGSFFSNLDDLISSYQSKIEELETLKKKLLQDMFI